MEYEENWLSCGKRVCILNLQRTNNLIRCCFCSALNMGQFRPSNYPYCLIRFSCSSCTFLFLSLHSTQSYSWCKNANSGKENKMFKWNKCIKRDFGALFHWLHERRRLRWFWVQNNKQIDVESRSIHKMYANFISISKRFTIIWE